MGWMMHHKEFLFVSAKNSQIAVSMISNSPEQIEWTDEKFTSINDDFLLGYHKSSTYLD